MSGEHERNFYLALNRGLYSEVEILSEHLDKSSRYYISRNFDVCDVREIRTWCLRWMSTQNKQYCNVFIKGNIKVKELLNNGIVPWQCDDYFTLLPYIDYPDELIEYWRNDRPNEYLSTFPVWSMISQEIAMKENESSLLKYTYPEKLYSSNRIKTDMSMFKTPFSHVGVWKKNILINDDGKEYTPLAINKDLAYEIKGSYCLPVTRYAQGMSTGLYHGKSEDKKYCGTFYYYEPESTTFLSGENILIAETKCSASQFLYNRNHNEELRIIIEGYLQDPENEKWERGVYRRDFRYTPNEVHVLGFQKNKDPTAVPQIRFYIAGEFVKGNNETLYGAEDVFDQILCANAFQQGYDIVILTRMIGSFQVVIEVLDVRDREDSWASLIYTNP